MEKRVTHYWEQLNKKYSSNQVFLMLCYWTLSTYQQAVAGKECPAGVEEWRVHLRDMFRTSMDYDVQEAAFRLSDRIEWSLLGNDESSLELLEEFSCEVSVFLKEGSFFLNIEYVPREHLMENLHRVMEMIFRAASLDEAYPMTPLSIEQVMRRLYAKSNYTNMTNYLTGNGLLIELHQQMLGSEKGTLLARDIEVAIADIDTIMRYMQGTSNVDFQSNFVKADGTLNDKPDIAVFDTTKGQNKCVAIIECIRPKESVEKSNPEKTNLENKNLDMNRIYTDWLRVMQALETISETGKASVIVTSGALTRRNEAKLRKEVVSKDWVEAVITLPPNLYSNTRIGSEILVFNKRKPSERREKILFIDISECFFRDHRNYYSITQHGLDVTSEIFHNYEEKEGISCVVDNAVVAEGICSLKPFLYLEMKSAKTLKQPVLRLKEIAYVMRGVQLKKEEEELLCQNGEAHYLNVKDIRDGNICYEDSRMITPKNRDWHRKFQIQEDDILITSKGSTFKVAIVGENPPEAYICGNLTLLRVDQEKYHPYVLYEFLTSDEGQRTLESIQSGTTIRVLNNTNLAEMFIPKHEEKTMHRVGEQLKDNRRNYEAERKRLTEQYTRERKDLLKLVGMEAR